MRKKTVLRIIVILVAAVALGVVATLIAYEYLNSDDSPAIGMELPEFVAEETTEPPPTEPEPTEPPPIAPPNAPPSGLLLLPCPDAVEVPP